MEENRNEMPVQDAAAEEQELSEQRRIRREKLKALSDAGQDPFVITKFPVTAYTVDVKEQYEEGKRVCLAGRMMSRRIMGKASFANLADEKGNLQIYVRRDDVGEEEYAGFKKWDIGDIIGVEGFEFVTKTGEISLHAEKIVLLAKSLLPLPEKFHGLTNQELRYRQRYLDLIVNPEVKDTFYKRSQILREIRNYLDSKGFLEVDTPILVPLEIGASARPFVTHHNTLDIGRAVTELQ